MAGFEPWSFGVGSDRSPHCTTTSPMTSFHSYDLTSTPIIAFYDPTVGQCNKQIIAYCSYPMLK